MDADGSPAYRIEESDLAEADRTAALLSIQYRNGPEYADVWHRCLLDAIQNLARFPGPLANPIIREKTPERPEIRRLLYRGPGARQTRMQPGYRVLYTIIRLSDDEIIIRILRILHTSLDTAE